MREGRPIGRHEAFAEEAAEVTGSYLFFALDEHLDVHRQAAVGLQEGADRPELHNWKNQRNARSRKVWLYVALALLPVIIFVLMLLLART